MEKNAGQKIRLALFVIAGFVFFTVAVYLIGNKQSMFSKTITVKSVFRNVNGLQLGNNVRYSGINVGNVSRLELMSDTSILVEMVISEKYRQHLRKDAIATIGSDGLVGSMIINIVPGAGELPPVEPGDYIDSYSRISANDMLSSFNTTGENAALLTADLLQITRAINNGEGTLGLLISDPAIARDLKETAAHLKTTGQKTVQIMDDVRKILDNLNKDETLAGIIFSDTSAGNQFKNMLVGLQDLSEGVNASLDSVNRFIATVNKLSDDIENTEGPLNAAIYDTLIVDDLRQTVSNIKLASQQFNEVMEAVKQSRFLRKYFNLQEEENKKSKRN